MSWLTAMTPNWPSMAWLSASLSSVGSSLTHGAHQVAQRLTRVGTPLKSARLMSPPSGSLKRFPAPACPCGCGRRPSPARRARRPASSCGASGFCLSQPATIRARSRGSAARTTPNQMWGGRFAGGPAAVMREINASIAVDKRLWREDIAASKAHAAMLGRAGHHVRRGGRGDRATASTASPANMPPASWSRIRRSRTSTCMSSSASAS